MSGSEGGNNLKKKSNAEGKRPCREIILKWLFSTIEPGDSRTAGQKVLIEEGKALRRLVGSTASR